MKEKDILTDFKDQQLIIYAEKDDNTIGPVQTGSYLARNYLDEFYYIWGNFEKSLFDKLQNNVISPIYLYMSLEELTISELAARVKLPKYKVRKHLEFKHFLKIKVKELKRYAEVFNIPVANFFQIINTRQDANWRMGYSAKVENAKSLTISQEKTNNPLLVITKPEKNKP